MFDILFPKFWTSSTLYTFCKNFKINKFILASQSLCNDRWPEQISSYLLQSLDFVHKFQNYRFWLNFVDPFSKIFCFLTDKSWRIGATTWAILLREYGLQVSFQEPQILEHEKFIDLCLWHVMTRLNFVSYFMLKLKTKICQILLSYRYISHIPFFKKITYIQSIKY